jgi:YegS/Rv2252/BmrU family lipid kinase
MLRRPPDPTHPAAAGGDPAEAESAQPEHAVAHRRILAVLNPVAGPRAIPRPTKELRRWAERLGVHLDIVETRPDLNGGAAAVAADGEYDCLLAVGGDGTVMEVAGAAMTMGIPLAILPRGSANAVAWRFGIPFDVGQALKVAVHGRAVHIDVARTPHRDFLIMAGLGYDAAVIRGATRSLKRRLGFLAYLYSALRNLSRRPYHFRVFLDDRPPFRVRGATAVIADIGSLAGNIRLVKEVDPQDGVLDLVVVAPENFRDFFRLVFWGVLGRLAEDPRVRTYRASKIKIECRPLAPLQLDGDDIRGRHRELEAEVLPSALMLMVPHEAKRFPWMPEVKWEQGKLRRQ